MIKSQAIVVSVKFSVGCKTHKNEIKKCLIFHGRNKKLPNTSESFINKKIL